MKKLLLMNIFFVSLIKADIIIRPAVISELDAILELDRQVTFEFFYPAYLNLFNNLGIIKDAKDVLEIELSEDQKSFPEYIKIVNENRLLVAWDNYQNIPCGLLTFHKEGDLMQLDLLLVNSEYRNQGIGKKLVRVALSSFPSIMACVVYPLQFNNDNTLNFYKSLGFKNLGVGPSDKYTNYGVSYSKAFYFFKLNLIE